MRCRINQQRHMSVNYWMKSLAVAHMRRGSNNVHTLLNIASLLLITLGSSLALSKLRHLPDWSQRQYMQCFILLAPLIGLAVGIAELCMQFTMTWDTIISLILLLTMTLFVASAFGLSPVRLALMTWFVAQHKGTVDPQLHAPGVQSRLAQPRLRKRRLGVLVSRTIRAQ